MGDRNISDPTMVLQRNTDVNQERGFGSSQTDIPLGTSTQQAIAQIIAAETGVDLNSLRANTPLEILSDAGVDSKQISHFKRALEVGLGLSEPLPITTLLTARTIADLEVEIFRISIRIKRELVTCLSSEGSKMPLFLFPPGIGDIVVWLSLLRYLPSRPIYAFRLKGVVPGEPVFQTLDELLDCYQSEIKALQPHGPYAFLGVCFGGLVAFELAKRLESAGDSVSFVGGIDNPANFCVFSLDFFRFLELDILTLRGVFTPEEREVAKVELQKTPTNHLAIELMTRYPSQLNKAHLTLEQMQTLRHVLHSVTVMVRGYKPLGRVAHFNSFWVEPMDDWCFSRDEWEVEMRKWALISPDVAFHFLPGNHYTAVSAEHVENLQQILNEQLALRGV